ncbi:MAG: Hachiman antiphage defense system protein HamA [Negativicutes bacterium]
MINQWLVEELRESAQFCFSVTDVTEKTPVTENIKKHIAMHLITCYRNPSYLKTMFQNKTPNTLEEYLKTLVFVPSDPANQLMQNTRQGDWGEVLVSLLLIELRKLIVPTPKLRWKINNEKSMFGTDVFAISFGTDDEISQLVYCEVKTRRTYDHQLAVEAYASLYRDNSSSLPQIIDFVARTLFEQKRYEDATKMLHAFDNIDQLPKNYEIYLIVEKSQWEEKTLSKLNATPPLLPCLNINILLIDDMQSLVNEINALAIKEGKKIVYG